MSFRIYFIIFIRRTSMQKRILILQMRPETPVANAEFQAILSKGELSIDQVRRIRVEQQGDSNLDLDDYCAIIAGGSPFDLSTPNEDKSQIQKEVERFFDVLLPEVFNRDMPFLGACCGNGLLGKFRGVNISSKYSEPISSVQISITKEGLQDALLEGFPKYFDALVGHKEACDAIPEGAVLLATSAQCPVQMFRLKKNIYATQFHPEADEEQFCLRIDHYKDYGYFKPEESNQLKQKLKGVQTPYSNLILKRFVKKYLIV